MDLKRSFKGEKEQDREPSDAHSNSKTEIGEERTVQVRGADGERGPRV